MFSPGEDISSFLKYDGSMPTKDEKFLGQNKPTKAPAAPKPAGLSEPAKPAPQKASDTDAKKQAWFATPSSTRLRQRAKQELSVGRLVRELHEFVCSCRRSLEKSRGKE